MTHLATAERVLDARVLPPETRPDEALARFDALAPGERFVLVLGDAGLEVLGRLQAKRPGRFEWSLLKTGPSVWRVEVSRRDDAAGTTRQVLEALAWDHDRLDALEEAAFRARESGDFPAAFDLYAEFCVGLRRHIGFEEEVLFPVFEAASGMPADAGPTAVMRAEHREIRELMDQIAAGIGDAAAPVETPRAMLHAALHEHNLKEEHVLYPSTDALLGPEAADRLVARIQAYGTVPGVG